MRPVVSCVALCITTSVLLGCTVEPTGDSEAPARDPAADDPKPDAPPPSNFVDVDTLGGLVVGGNIIDLTQVKIPLACYQRITRYTPGDEPTPQQPGVHYPAMLDDPNAPLPPPQPSTTFVDGRASSSLRSHSGSRFDPNGPAPVTFVWTQAEAPLVGALRSIRPSDQRFSPGVVRVWFVRTELCVRKQAGTCAVGTEGADRTDSMIYDVGCATELDISRLNPRKPVLPPNRPRTAGLPHIVQAPGRTEIFQGERLAWQLRSCNRVTCGPWSEGKELDWPLPPPIHSAPDDGTEVSIGQIGTTVRLEWTDVIGASTYLVCIYGNRDYCTAGRTTGSRFDGVWVDCNQNQSGICQSNPRVRLDTAARNVLRRLGDGEVHWAVRSCGRTNTSATDDPTNCGPFSAAADDRTLNLVEN